MNICLVDRKNKGNSKNTTYKESKQMTTDKWDELYLAAKNVLHPRDVSRCMEAGGVAAAIELESGKIYIGVCFDTAWTLGICAE